MMRPEAQTFIVGWHRAALPFDQIMWCLRPLIMRDLRGLRRIQKRHIDDVLQQGWLRLWAALTENTLLLAPMTLFEASKYVSNRCGTSTHLYNQRKYESFPDWRDEETYEDSITEIVIGASLKSIGKPGHAYYTRRVDTLTDLERAIRATAQWCGDDMRKLASLYYLTTSVSAHDAGQIAGLTLQYRERRATRAAGLHYWNRKVLAHLQERLEEYRPLEPDKHHWKRCIKRGQLEPVRQLAQHYSDDAFKLLALYSLITSVSRKTICDELGHDDSKLNYQMTNIREELRALYRRTHP